MNRLTLHILAPSMFITFSIILFQFAVHEVTSHAQDLDDVTISGRVADQNAAGI